MKKGIKIFIIVTTLVLLIALIYFMFIYRKTTDENKKTLTVVEEITLNGNEEEILLELINVNNRLLNPTTEQESNNNSYIEVTKPTEATSLKNFCKTLYEARKTINEQGETIYLFDMETKSKDSDEPVRRIIVTRNGELTFCTFVESDYENLNDEETNIDSNGSINLGTEFTKALLQGLSNKINEMWESAITFDNVNYNNILSKI